VSNHNHIGTRNVWTLCPACAAEGGGLRRNARRPASASLGASTTESPEDTARAATEPPLEVLPVLKQ